jgi:hypothetical protein
MPISFLSRISIFPLITVWDKTTVIDIARCYVFEVEKYSKTQAIVLYGSYAKGIAGKE